MKKTKQPEEKACNKDKLKISIMIPTYNSSKTIRESLDSALAQNCPYKEVVVVDDCSTDDTVSIVLSEYPNVRVSVNPENLQIGVNLANCLLQARAPYVVFLCADDLFADPNVCSDIVKVFDEKKDIGVISRFFYFFMDGHKGAIGVCRDKNILTSSCCPSGMAFRKMKVWGANRIFIEMPLIVTQYLEKYRWTMLEYDTIAARFHPGGNTGTKTSYYKESPLQNWIGITGDQKFKFHEGFVQLKNRAPHLLIPELKLAIKMNKEILKEPRFWVFASVALLVPGCVLRPFTNFYRHRITRHHVKTIKRGQEVKEEQYTKAGIF